MIIGTVETLESLLDGFWKDPRKEVAPEKLEVARNLASIYSRLVITSFISSSIASYLEHETLSYLSRELSTLSRKIPFSQAQKMEEEGRQTDDGYVGYPFWVPSSQEDFNRFYRSLHSYYSRYQDYLEVLDKDISPLEGTYPYPRNSKRFYESLERSLKYVSMARKKIFKASQEDLPKVSSMVRRMTKNLRLIRDGLFDYKSLAYNVQRVDNVSEGSEVEWGDLYH